MKNKMLLLIVVTVMLVPLSTAQNMSVQDEAAIKKPALNYIEGWYTGDASRMESALHPELAKRMVETAPDGKSRFNSMGAMTLVQKTRACGGSKTPKELQQKDITILDRFNNAAVVKVVASSWGMEDRKCAMVVEAQTLIRYRNAKKQTQRS